MSASTTPAPTCRVQLIDHCRVVPHGEELKIWFLKQNDAWVRAKDHPLAQVEVDDSERESRTLPAGMVWTREIELRLARGTRILCRISSPLAQKGEIFDFLTRGASRTRRQQREIYYQVAGNYRLERASGTATHL